MRKTILLLGMNESSAEKDPLIGRCQSVHTIEHGGGAEFSAPPLRQDPSCSGKGLGRFFDGKRKNDSFGLKNGQGSSTLGDEDVKFFIGLF